MIIINEIDRNNLQDIDKCDGTFTIDTKLVVSAEKGIIHYTVLRIPPYEKCYPVDKINYATYICNTERIGYIAYINGQVVGQIRLSKHWNKYADIEDIIVDKIYRRCGVGSELINNAKRWARQNQLAGLMVETQNNNYGACKLYEHCGFKLSGFDRSLYQGINPRTDEIALYWYWICE
jgi:streptothricin acetyltransferase